MQKDLSSLKIYIGNFEFKDFSFANSVTKKIEMRENIESLYSAIYVPAKNNPYGFKQKRQNIHMISIGCNLINNDEAVEGRDVTLNGSFLQPVDIYKKRSPKRICIISALI
jgi:hypothetical protein